MICIFLSFYHLMALNLLQGKALRAGISTSDQADLGQRDGFVFRFMSRPHFLLIALAAATLSPSVQALQFQFSLDFTSGPLSGQSAQGLFETTSGEGFKTIENGGLLGFAISMDGENFEAIHDAFYPQFPAINAVGGGTSISALEFISSLGPDGGALHLTFSSDPFVSEGRYTPAGGDSSSGAFRSAPTLVELPDSGTTGLSLATAMVGMAMLRRRVLRG
jgi:hypothetical protein